MLKQVFDLRTILVTTVALLLLSAGVVWHLQVHQKQSATSDAVIQQETYARNVSELINLKVRIQRDKRGYQYSKSSFHLELYKADKKQILDKIGQLNSLMAGTEYAPAYEQLKHQIMAGIEHYDMQIAYINTQPESVAREKIIAQENVAFAASQKTESDAGLLINRFIKRSSELKELLKQDHEFSNYSFILFVAGCLLIIGVLLYTVIKWVDAENKKVFSKLQAAKMEATFDQAAIGMAIVGLGGRWIKVNRSLCAIVGYTQDELMQKTFQDITHPEDLEKDLANVHQLLNGYADQYEMEKRYFHKSGQEVWVKLYVTMVKNEAGAPLHFLSQIRDITQERKNQIEMIESREKYQSIIDNSLNGILLGDENGNIIEANAATARIFGFDTVDAFKNADRKKLIAPEDADRLQQMHDLRRKNKHVVSELIGVRNDGSKFPMLLYSSIFQGPSGKRRIVSEFIDITEHKRTETLLKEQQVRMLNVIEGTRAGTWEWNVQTGETLFNENWASIIGYTLEELQPVSIETWAKFAHPSDLEKSNEKLNDCFSGKSEYYECECRMRHKDGHWVWVLDRGKVMSWTPDGKPLWMFGTHTDISVLKNAYNLLEEKERKYREIFNSTYQLNGLLSLDGDVLEMNQTALEFGGLQESDVIGKKYWDCHWWQVNEEGRIRIRQEISRAANGEQVHFEAEILDKHHKPVPILFNLKPVFDQQGEAIAIIPEGRPIQDIQEARKALQAKNDELQEFAYMAAHDLKEPLRMISSFMNMLQKKYSSDLDEKANTYINFAIDGANRLTTLINSLLEYARAGSKQAPFEHFDLEGTMKEVVAIKKATIEASNASVTWTQLPEIYAQKTAIQLLMQNLLGNALKYCKTGIPPVIKITATELDECWQIAVADNGIGIAQEHLEKIFGLFTRLQNSKEYGGTGMGLATCKKIVENHGGRIWADSEPGNGATFYFIIQKP